MHRATAGQWNTEQQGPRPTPPRPCVSLRPHVAQQPCDALPLPNHTPPVPCVHHYSARGTRRTSPGLRRESIGPLPTSAGHIIGRTPHVAGGAGRGAHGL